MIVHQREVDFNLADDHEYMLGGSYTATSRLNYQFYLWKESLHFNIHPSIPLPPRGACVADVATGTAIWLTDLAGEMPPDAQLNGFDIDLDQAPPNAWLPPNVSLSKWSVFDEPPEGMIGIHDVVHVRLLGFVVKHGNPRPILRNLLKLLKPGGYLQWEDFNCPGTTVKSMSRGLYTPSLHKIKKLVYSQGRNNWAIELAETFKQEGLLDSKTNHYGDRLELIKANSDQHLLTFEEFASNLEHTGQGAEAEAVYKLIQGAHKESLQGAALCMPRVVCIGRKPVVHSHMSDL